ncbi:hypothetical protein NLJ89_g5516 [Agrocybe chaxingu]|uniref:Uncharacterized protein n=1 Tax=Agrocybe chaxingu TaxID=84603 RepID=A0A9W8MX76_9AGAR|nr:hypothetical protein NLJ89_g5516 [Agrocybe chaxingu]
MASLSDQIDAFTRNTRAVNSTASQIAHSVSHPDVVPGLFTRAVLDASLGDLIRDIDTSELGLFTLVSAPARKNYDKDSRLTQDPEIKRTEFTGATPLKRRQSRREDREIEPEVYIYAALKYIGQYEPIRPMPRAYDQIVAILERVKSVRERIASLNVTLKQTVVVDDGASVKTRVEQEERRIQDLQARIAELSKKKGSAVRPEKLKAARPKVKQQPTKQQTPDASPASSREENRWTTPGEPSRVLRFTDNLLDEEVNLGDVSTTSFGSPLANLKPTRLFADPAFLSDDKTIAQSSNFDDDSGPYDASEIQEEKVEEVEKSSTHSLEADVGESSILTPRNIPLKGAQNTEPPLKSAGVPVARPRKLKVNAEVERIVSKIWSTISDVIASPKESMSVSETINYLQQLAAQSPQPESPVASSTSSLVGDGPPTFQQVMTAQLLTMLLSTPSHSMSLSQVKENLAARAKSTGAGVTASSTTRVIYGCVGKRLVKIDRGGREQIVKFDI